MARIMKLEETQKIWVLMLTKHTSLNRRRGTLPKICLFSPKCSFFFPSGPLVFNFTTPVESHWVIFNCRMQDAFPTISPPAATYFCLNGLLFFFMELCLHMGENCKPVRRTQRCQVGQLIITSRKPQDNCRVSAGRLLSSVLGVYALLHLQ